MPAQAQWPPSWRCAAAFGLAGRTDLLVPGSESERFRRLDRRVFGPACLALATGAACAALAG